MICTWYDPLLKGFSITGMLSNIYLLD